MTSFAFNLFSIVYETTANRLTRVVVAGTALSKIRSRTRPQDYTVKCPAAVRPYSALKGEGLPRVQILILKMQDGIATPFSLTIASNLHAN
jgi:hypothetical protein